MIRSSRSVVLFLAVVALIGIVSRQAAVAEQPSKAIAQSGKVGATRHRHSNNRALAARRHLLRKKKHVCAGPGIPPGAIIDHSEDPAKIYFGSPSIAVLPNGDYVASHDLFGPEAKREGSITKIFRSTDRGQTWTHLTDIDGAFWSSLFVHRGRLYLFGPIASYGNLVIRRSDDGGKTWTEPKDENTGLIAVGRYHSAPMPFVEYNGRLWRAVETKVTKTHIWGDFAAGVVSVPVDADLLKAKNWVKSNPLPFTMLPPGRTWLEGNVVVTPDSGVVNILRTRSPGGKTAAKVTVSSDGRKVSFDPERDFIQFPGGSSKFTIRYDAKSKRYWSLVNYEETPEAYRNVLALTSSADLNNWRVDSIVLRHPDGKNHAWQYIDWQFDGDDIIAASRTAWDESHRAHDADYMTFHRIEDFRTLGERKPAKIQQPSGSR